MGDPACPVDIPALIRILLPAADGRDGRRHIHVVLDPERRDLADAIRGALEGVDRAGVIVDCRAPYDRRRERRSVPVDWRTADRRRPVVRIRRCRDRAAGRGHHGPAVTPRCGVRPSPPERYAAGNATGRCLASAARRSDVRRRAPSPRCAWRPLSPARSRALHGNCAP